MLDVQLADSLPHYIPLDWSTSEGQKRALNALELQLQIVVIRLALYILDPEAQSSGRAVHVLNNSHLSDSYGMCTKNIIFWHNILHL